MKTLKFIKFMNIAFMWFFITMTDFSNFNLTGTIVMTLIIITAGLGTIIIYIVKEDPSDNKKVGSEE